ncbi:hypothetical protein TNIN_367681 [Trichonephila inaurata madagascariensis]|uniref:Uncharacterized protein n=1 Tax=Trichonephila inaurata madagascariensis TaxID=2747483 RepID=A0A8X6YCC4_9ARAC|nr:hypothetical protein TNIN_367681 [Trichonephila inaurata madagascariensis]
MGPFNRKHVPRIFQLTVPEKPDAVRQQRQSQDIKISHFLQHSREKKGDFPPGTWTVGGAPKPDDSPPHAGRENHMGLAKPQKSQSNSIDEHADFEAQELF